MSDALDAVAKAMDRTRKLAASELVRKEDLEAELLKLGAQRERAAGNEAMTAALDARIAETSAELAACEQRHREAVAEMAELRKLADQARTGDARAVVAAATASLETDPLLPSDEDIALGNVRAHLRDLEARTKVAEEIAPASKADEEPDEVLEHGTPGKKTF